MSSTTSINPLGPPEGLDLSIPGLKHFLPQLLQYGHLVQHDAYLQKDGCGLILWVLQLLNLDEAFKELNSQGKMIRFSLHATMGEESCLINNKIMGSFTFGHLESSQSINWILDLNEGVGNNRIQMEGLKRMPAADFSGMILSLERVVQQSSLLVYGTYNEGQFVLMAIDHQPQAILKFPGQFMVVAGSSKEDRQLIEVKSLQYQDKGLVLVLEEGFGGIWIPEKTDRNKGVVATYNGEKVVLF